MTLGHKQTAPHPPGSSASSVGRRPGLGPPLPGAALPTATQRHRTHKKGKKKKIKIKKKEVIPAKKSTPKHRRQSAVCVLGVQTAHLLSLDPLRSYSRGGRKQRTWLFSRGVFTSRSGEGGGKACCCWGCRGARKHHRPWPAPPWPAPPPLPGLPPSAAPAGAPPSGPAPSCGAHPSCLRAPTRGQGTPLHTDSPPRPP